MIGGAVLAGARTRRILNQVGSPPQSSSLYSQTAVGLVLTSGSDDLQSARQRGSDATAELSSARILAVRAQADESLALIARGSGASFAQDFNEVAARLRSDNRQGSPRRCRTHCAAWVVTNLPISRAGLSGFFQEHKDVTDLQDNGQYPQAIDQTSTGEAPYLDLIVGVLKNEIKASQQRFTAAITRASFDASVHVFRSSPWAQC